MMFIRNFLQDINNYIYLANYIKPDEIQINAPLRVCTVKALSKEEIAKIRNDFIFACTGIDIVSVYDQREHKDIISLSDLDTLKRRGKMKRKLIRRPKYANKSYF